MAKRMLSDHVVVYEKHRRVHGRLPNLITQKSFSEKIAYRKLYPQKIYSSLSDKFFVREFVRNRVGDNHLPKLLCVASTMAKFDFTKLPAAFVMKATHGSGWVELVYEKERANLEALRSKACSWLQQDFSRVLRERHYAPIAPQIIFEELLTDRGAAVDDIKIHCFRKSGKLTRFIQIHTQRFTDHKINLFTEEWQALDLDHGFPRQDPKTIEKPRNLPEILKVADRLSREFNYVRVDLYNSEDRVIFGELTFTPGAALTPFSPPEADILWGALFDPDTIHFNSA